MIKLKIKAINAWPLDYEKCIPGPVDEELLPVVLENILCGENALIGLQAQERRRERRKQISLEIISNINRRENEEANQREKKSGFLFLRGTRVQRKMEEDQNKADEDNEENSEDNNIDQMSDSLEDDNQAELERQISSHNSNQNWTHSLNMTGQFKYQKDNYFNFLLRIEEVKTALQSLTMWKS
ncbi:MAG: hypothetical protein EZS28_010899 [Streblomastix strix]|uniref:Uncharacterized protein n=1 Tax=Streblomastix strix TaxID=222440 RepID=A0A5J4WH09_9EUKA|nr:MAG: hypothetical protein EZS28_010899 [Streblomastix strix]